jgi:hypothetical protein
MTTMTTDTIDITAPLSSETVDALSKLNEDTPFLSTRRAEALAAFERAPMPTRKDEYWRFTKLRGVELDTVPTFIGCDGMEAAQERAARSLTANV